MPASRSAVATATVAAATVAAAMASKEWTCVLVDVSSGMRPHLADAVAAVRDLLCGKLFTSSPKGCHVAIGLLGTRATENELSPELGGYEHISVTSPMAPLRCAAVESLDAIEIEGECADPVDGVVVAASAIEAAAGTYMGKRNIVLITAGKCAAAAEDDELEQIAEQMNNAAKHKPDGVHPTAVTAGFDRARAHRDPAGTEADGAARDGLVRALGPMASKLGGRFRALTLPAAAAAYRDPAKQTRSTQTAHTLEIGALRLPVVGMKKVGAGAKLPWAAVSKPALAGDEAEPALAPDKTIERERRYFTQAQPDVDVAADERASAFRFGRDLVPVFGVDEDYTKFVAEGKALSLLGFAPAHTVPRHLFCAAPDVLVADPKAGFYRK